MDQKEQLIKTGLELFSSQSYNATGVREITKAAGVPTGSFHYYFKNKEEFAAELLDQFFERGHNAHISKIIFDPSLNARQKLIQSFEAMIGLHYKKGSECGTLSSCLMGNLGQEVGAESELIAAKIHEYYDKIVYGIKTMINLGKQDGSMPDTMDADRLAPFIFDAYEGALLRRKIERSNKPLEDFMFNLQQMI